MNIMSMIVRCLRIVFGVGLLIALFQGMFLCKQIGMIIEVRSIQKTLTEQRQVAHEVELTAVTDVVMSTNKKLDFWKAITEQCPILFVEDFRELDRIK